MANTLLLKKSGTASDTPTAGELSYGELAINYADGKLFFKNSSDNVEEFSVNDWDTGVFSGHVLIGSTDDSNHLLHVDGAIGLSNNIHFASGGEITWAHGDASIVEGASSNYAIDFYNYDGSGNNLTLSLNPDHSATFAGDIVCGNINPTGYVWTDSYLRSDTQVMVSGNIYFDNSEANVFTAKGTSGVKLSTWNDSSWVAGLAIDGSNNATFAGDVTITGQLNITGDIDSYSVTDLDVVDKTITVGAGQIASNSGGSGIVVDGSGASILWDQSNQEWDSNQSVNVSGALRVSSSGIFSSGVTVDTLTVSSTSSTNFQGGTVTGGNLRTSNSGGSTTVVSHASSTGTGLSWGGANEFYLYANGAKQVTINKDYATFGGLIKDGSLGFGNGFWKNDNVVSHDFTVPSGEIWKSFDDINVNTGVNVTVNGTWTLTSGNFGET